jgi:tRNA(fMet)-specific endonuclease VapC
MANSVMLDTNIVIATLRKESRVQQALAATDSIFLPAIVVGELLYGAHNAQHPAKEMAKVETFLTGLDESAILPCDHATAQVYGWLKHRRSRIGQPIPENDFWIAAIAYQYDLPLVTRDAHFQEVEGIAVQVW